MPSAPASRANTLPTATHTATSVNQRVREHGYNELAPTLDGILVDLLRDASHGLKLSARDGLIEVFQHSANVWAGTARYTDGQRLQHQDALSDHLGYALRIIGANAPDALMAIAAAMLAFGAQSGSWPERLLPSEWTAAIARMATAFAFATVPDPDTLAFDCGMEEYAAGIDAFARHHRNLWS
jgi:hypothetical protein